MNPSCTEVMAPHHLCRTLRSSLPSWRHVPYPRSWQRELTQLRAAGRTQWITKDRSSRSSLDSVETLVQSRILIITGISIDTVERRQRTICISIEVQHAWSYPFPHKQTPSPCSPLIRHRLISMLSSGARLRLPLVVHACIYVLHVPFPDRQVNIH